MAPRFFRKMALLAKLETTYGTDAVPTGVANAMLVTNVNVTPLAGQEVSRELLKPYLGNQGVILVGTYAQIEFDVEMAGSGTAGTPPAYSALLRACGLSETIDTGVSVEYEPVSTGFESVSLYYHSDGVRHIILGARGTVTLNLTPSQIPRWRFSFSGLLGTITDAAMPAVDDTAFQTPLPITKSNTTLNLHGLASVGESLSVDLGNSVETRFLIGHESVQITNRNSTGSAVIEASLLAVKDWFQLAQARTRGNLTLTHGTAAGHIVKVESDAVEIGRPTQGETQGIVNYTIPLSFAATGAGDNEVKFTFQ